MATRTDEDVQLLKAKGAFVLHELVDRVAHATEADRIDMHAQVTDLFDGVTHNAARDSIADPAAYLEACDKGAYDAPAATAAPPTADQLRIQELQAQIDAMTASAASVPATPPEQSPATSTPAQPLGDATVPTSTTPGPSEPVAPGAPVPVPGDADATQQPTATGAPDATS